MQESISGAVEVLRREAGAVLRKLKSHPRELSDLLRLAAYLFAAGCDLARSVALPHAKDGSPEDEEHEFEARPLAAWLRQVEALSQDVEATEFYSLIVEVLEAIEEALLALDPAEQEVLPAKTRVQGGRDWDFDRVVLHWIGRPGALGKLRDELETAAEEGNIPLPPRPSPLPTDGLVSLRLLLESSRPAPGLMHARPKQRTSGLVAELGRELSDLAGFKIALCPLPAASHPLFRIHEAGDSFHTLDCNSMRELELLQDEIDSVLQSAAVEQVPLVVFPELMVCDSLRQRIREFLRSSGSRWPFGVVVGSFHLQGDGTTSSASLPFNQACLLDHRGSPLAEHCKAARFVVSRRAVEKSPDWFPERPEKLRAEIRELIRYGRQIQLLETDLGPVALAICADLSTADVGCLKSVYQEVRPALVVVVSMTSETERFEDMMREFSLWQVATLFVNAASICPQGQVLAAVDLAQPQLPGSPPARLRWRKGAEAPLPPEAFYFHPPLGVAKKEWVSISAEMGEIGHRWLSHQGRVLGFMLDLGPLVRWVLLQADRRTHLSPS